MNIKIVSDGTRRGSKVINADTGVLLPNVVSVTWELDAENDWTPRVTMVLIDIPVELTGKAEVLVKQLDKPPIDKPAD